MQQQPVKRFHGVGPVTQRRMEALGIRTGADLAAWPLADLERHFGSSAGYYHRAAHGIANMRATVIVSATRGSSATLRISPRVAMSV